MPEEKPGQKKRRYPKGRHLSAFKRQRQNVRRASRNRLVRSRLKTIAKKVRAAVAKKDKGTAQESLKVAMSLYAKAASKGVVHAAHASRHISRLSSLVSHT
jgi:small subunit ribosomal protein S20